MSRRQKNNKHIVSNNNLLKSVYSYNFYFLLVSFLVTNKDSSYQYNGYHYYACCIICFIYCLFLAHNIKSYYWLVTFLSLYLENKSFS